MARHAATDSPYVSVVVPVFNEVDSVEPLHRELIGVLGGLGTSFEVVYVDDGSDDGSAERLGQIAQRDARVHVVSFRKNFGQAAAVQAGIDYSRGDVLVFLDGDMQNDPHDIPHLLEKVDEGYDVACGWRRDRRDAPARVIRSRIANWIIARVSGVALSDFGCMLKAFRREVIGDVRLYGEMHRLLPVLASAVGARITELPVNHRPRTYGKSKHSLLRNSRVMQDLIAVELLGRFAKPLYFFGVVALLLWAIALLLAALVAFQRLGPPGVDVQDNPLFLLSLVLFIVGVQSFLTGLLADLSMRNHHEALSKPAYVVREVIEKHRQKQPVADGRQAVRS